MDHIKAVIVEDELPAIENLQLKLKNSCPQIQVIASYKTSQEALEGIQRERPQLVFLDIGLDTLSGFDLLKRLKHLYFEVIFTTTSREHTLDALRAEAADYLAKPFTEDELIEAVDRAAARIRKNIPAHAFLTVYGIGKDLLLPVDQIMYCVADNNLTNVFVHNEKRPSLSAETLKTVEEQLPSSRFYRIHRSHCVNRDFIKAIDRSTGLSVEMADGRKLEIAQARKEGFYAWLGI